ncbi:MAG: hypothetical protein JWQ29_3341, partial [Phenylobacterium sp.]|nr:hypothetical protein [Phenylobacterium sp.]
MDPRATPRHAAAEAANRLAQAALRRNQGLTPPAPRRGIALAWRRPRIRRPA